MHSNEEPKFKRRYNEVFVVTREVAKANENAIADRVLCKGELIETYQTLMNELIKERERGG